MAVTTIQPTIKESLILDQKISDQAGCLKGRSVNALFLNSGEKGGMPGTAIAKLAEGIVTLVIIMTIATATFVGIAAGAIATSMTANPLKAVGIGLATSSVCVLGTFYATAMTANPFIGIGVGLVTSACVLGIFYKMCK